MDLEEIRQHWTSWGQKYGADLRATTKGHTAKIMEIDTLSRVIKKIVNELGSKISILEAGCGNGKNCLALAEEFMEARITGFDYIPEMVEAANEGITDSGISKDRLSFFEGDVLKMDLEPNSYEIVFTDRCLINLNTIKLQKQAINSLSKLIKPHGYLLMIENSITSYNRQNIARVAVGLEARTPDQFNLFFDEDQIIDFLPDAGLELIEIEDFISLHDLMLYVLVPMINDGKVDYGHPLVTAATQLNTALSSIEKNSIGAWGQNRLYICRRTN